MCLLVMRPARASRIRPWARIGLTPSATRVERGSQPPVATGPQRDDYIISDGPVDRSFSGEKRRISRQKAHNLHYRAWLMEPSRALRDVLDDRKMEDVASSLRATCSRRGLRDSAPSPLVVPGCFSGTPACHVHGVTRPPRGCSRWLEVAFDDSQVDDTSVGGHRDSRMSPRQSAYPGSWLELR
jgi:hypothetical protein